MATFSACLTSGTKRPYDTWTFVVVPEHVMDELGSKRIRVRGTIAGASFVGTVAKGEGVYRMPVPRDLQTQAGIARGDKVLVVMERDLKPEQVLIPDELQEALNAHRELVKQFDSLSPSHKRAWAQYVGSAKREETRKRRAAQAMEGIRSRTYPGT